MMQEGFKRLLARGIRIKITLGKMFNPYYQERTDGLDDIIRNKEKRDKEKT